MSFDLEARVGEIAVDVPLLEEISRIELRSQSRLDHRSIFLKSRLVLDEYGNGKR